MHDSTQNALLLCKTCTWTLSFHLNFSSTNTSEKVSLPSWLKWEGASIHPNRFVGSSCLLMEPVSSKNWQMMGELNLHVPFDYNKSVSFSPLLNVCNMMSKSLQNITYHGAMQCSYLSYKLKHGIAQIWQPRHGLYLFIYTNNNQFT